MLAAEEWAIREPGRMEGVPVSISERDAIEKALRSVCGIDGNAVTKMTRFKRPIYARRPSYVRQVSGRLGPDEWGWHFWFPFPLPPGFESKSFPVFVNDPSGVVEFGDAM